MTRFVSHLATELDEFLVFKRALGSPYVRGEYTLRSFDRFVLSYSRHHRPFRLDETLLAWLAGKGSEAGHGHGRSWCCAPVLLAPPPSRSGRAFVPGREWAPQSTKSEFLPFVFTDQQVRGPRPYDFRHTFAVHRLTRWYRTGVDINARLPWLSAYMGHNDILGTETYLTATPELLAIASRRFQRHMKRRRRGKP